MNILFKKFFKNNYISNKKKKTFDIFSQSSLDINNKLKITNKIYSIIKYFIFKKSDLVANCIITSKKKKKINKMNLCFPLSRYLLNIDSLNRQFPSFWTILSLLKFLVVNKHKLLNFKKIVFPIKYYRNFFLKYRIYFLLIFLKISKFKSKNFKININFKNSNLIKI
jgi:hypothetical protein